MHSAKVTKNGFSTPVPIERRAGCGPFPYVDTPSSDLSPLGKKRPEFTSLQNDSHSSRAPVGTGIGRRDTLKPMLPQHEDSPSARHGYTNMTIIPIMWTSCDHFFGNPTVKVTLAISITARDFLPQNRRISLSRSACLPCQSHPATTHGASSAAKWMWEFGERRQSEYLTVSPSRPLVGPH